MCIEMTDNRNFMASALSDLIFVFFGFPNVKEKALGYVQSYSQNSYNKKDQTNSIKDKRRVKMSVLVAFRKGWHADTTSGFLWCKMY